MEFTTSANVNRLIWISSLREHENGSTIRVIEDLEPYFKSINLSFDYYNLSTLAELSSVLDHISATSIPGVAPVIHIDMHGNLDNGLFIAASSEFMAWDVLSSKLKAINVSTQNNMCVVFATCYAFNMLKHLTFEDQSPCYLMIAPEEEINFGFVEDRIENFYRDVFGSLDVVRSYNQYLSSEMRLFHSEKMLAVVLARYLYISCIGKAGDKRKEKLLTEVFQSGIPNTRRNRRALRKTLQKVVRPDQKFVDRYVNSFLIGKPVCFRIEHLMKFAQKLPPKPKPLDFSI